MVSGIKDSIRLKGAELIENEVRSVRIALDFIDSGKGVLSCGC
jgi:hypothetical protein